MRMELFTFLSSDCPNCHLHHFLFSKIQNCSHSGAGLSRLLLNGGHQTSVVIVVVCKVFLQIIIVISLFPFSVLTLLVGDRKGIWLVKSLVLVCCWWWFDWSFARLFAPVVTATSIILCFSKHWLTQVYLEKWPLQRRERELLFAFLLFLDLLETLQLSNFAMNMSCFSRRTLQNMFRITHINCCLWQGVSTRKTAVSAGVIKWHATLSNRRDYLGRTCCPNGVFCYWM